MIKLENSTFGDVLGDAIKEIGEFYISNSTVHVSAVRPTAQQKHKKYEIVVAVDGFNATEDLGLREYQISVDLWSYSTLTEHMDFMIDLEDNLTNYISELFAGVEVVNTLHYDTPVGEKAFNSGLVIIFKRSAKNKQISG